MITNLRATVRSDDLHALLPWVTERSSLRLVADDLQDFAGPLLISGRNVTRHFVEFGGYGAEPAPLVSGATYEVTVEGLVSWATGRKAPEWNELFTVSIEGPPEKTRNNYITYPTLDR